MDRPQVNRRITEIVTACGESPFRRWRTLHQLKYPLFFRWMTPADRLGVLAAITAQVVADGKDNT